MTISSNMLKKRRVMSAEYRLQSYNRHTYKGGRLRSSHPLKSGELLSPIAIPAFRWYQVTGGKDKYSLYSCLTGTADEQSIG